MRQIISLIILLLLASVSEGQTYSVVSGDTPCPQPSAMYAPLSAAAGTNLTRGSGAMTFARTSSDWGCESTAGVLSTVTTGNPCYQAGSKGLKLEGARTNVANYSEELNSWTSVSTPVIASNGTNDPAGGTTADTIQDDNASAFESKYILHTIPNDSSWWSTSAFIARPIGSYTQLTNRGMTGGTSVWGGGTNIDTDGSFCYGTGYNFNTDWVYVYGAAQNNSSGNTTFQFTWYPAYFSGGNCGATPQNSYTGTHAYWGAQIENARFSSSYISTGTATTDITRNYASLSVPEASNFAVNNSVICVDFTPYHAGDSYGDTNLTLIDSRLDDDNRVQMYWDGTNNKFVFNKKIASTSYDADYSLNIVKDTTYKVCGRLSSTSGVDIWVNGVKGSADANTTNATLDGTSFFVGSDEGSIGSAWGYVRNLMTWVSKIPEHTIKNYTAGICPVR